MTIATVASVCPICRALPTEPHATGTDFEYGTTPDQEWSLLRCAACDVVVLSPRPADSELSTIYPPNYYAYDFTAKRSLGFRVKGLIDRRTVGRYLKYGPANASILDVGCGDGRLLRMFAARGVPNERLFGMELDEKAVASARSQGLNVSLGRFEDVDYAPGKFGLAIMQQVIEHVVDPADVLSRLHTVLAPDGAVVLETPNTASWDHWMFSSRHWGGYHIPRHFYLFNPASMTRLLEKSGFRVTEVRALASPSFWIQSVHHAAVEGRAARPVVKFFDSHLPSPLALAGFSALDVLGKALKVTSNMRVVAVKR